MKQKDVIIGNLIKSWQSGKCMNVTLCVTENCNMACKYCYMINKNNKRVMTYKTAIDVVNYVLTNEEYLKEEAVVFDFIGGEPLLQINLIDKVCDYIVSYLYKNNHKWFDKYRFMITSNGLLYQDEEVQSFINKHAGHISFTISLDGNKEKQDTSRIKKDGSGTYDDVVKSVPLWLSQFPSAFVKSTFSHDDLPYLRDSVIHLWSLGVKNVMANIVYEDVWHPGDDVIFEEQLNLLADYVIENDLWDKYSVRFFNPNLGLPLSEEDKKRNVCGAGKQTVAFDCDGEIFPCIRFLDFCMNDLKSKSIGNVYGEINNNILKTFSFLSIENSMDAECKECQVSKSCDFCTAFNYISSKDKTIYERTKYNCFMHKANVRANNRLWYNYSKIHNATSQKTKLKLLIKNISSLKYLNVLLSDDVMPHCSYTNRLTSNKVMSNEMIDAAIDFCYKYFLIPIFIGDKQIGLNREDNIYFKISQEENLGINDAYVYDGNSFKSVSCGSIIITINRSILNGFDEIVIQAAKLYRRINIFVQDIEEMNANDMAMYQIGLDKIISELSKWSHKPVINIFNDCYRYCEAGVTSLTLAPDGLIYLCPAFYFNQLKHTAVGTIHDDYFSYSAPKTAKKESTAIVSEKEAIYSNCIYNNYICTTELNIPSEQYVRIEKINQNQAKIYNGSHSVK